VADTVTGSIEHLAYYDALGRMSETDADWPVLNAGLQVLLLVDAWLDRGTSAARASAYGIAAVRSAIDGVPTTVMARRILSRIVDAGDQASEPDAPHIAQHLMAYGRSLDYDGGYALAVDVYQTLLRHVPSSLDADIAIDAQMRLGYCLRVQDDWSGAEAAYGHAHSIAFARGDIAKALHARIGDASVAFSRGNLPAAESMLDEIIVEASHPELTDIRSMALHDRATVAILRGQYDHAARLAYGALKLTRSLTARDRILADLANAFAQLGVLDAARDAYIVLASTAQEHYVRWLAMINLLEVSAFQGNEAVFEDYRVDLSGERLPSVLRAQAYYYTAVGYHAFGKHAAAVRALEQATELAETHHYNRLLFQVEELTAAVKRGADATRRAARSAPTELQDVSAAVSEMRELAGV
jgi:tetratricopeptide (TPR) repeat protein